MLMDRIAGHSIGDCQHECRSMRGCDTINLFEREGALQLPVCQLLHCGAPPPGRLPSSWPPLNIGPAIVYRLRRCPAHWNSTADAAAPPPDCVPLVAEPALPSPPRRIHILSMGRVGSSYLIDKFEQAGVRVIFEPFRTIVEGEAILPAL